MAEATPKTMTVSRARQALRAVFVARLVQQMRRTGVMRAIFRATFDASIAETSFPPPLRAAGVHAVLKPLCRSGVAAGGAGGGGPGQTRAQLKMKVAATELLRAA